MGPSRPPLRWIAPPNVGDVLVAWHVVTIGGGYENTPGPGWTVFAKSDHLPDATANNRHRMRARLSEAVKRAGLYEMADAFVYAMMEGQWADAADDKKTEESLRHAVYELVGKAFADGSPDV